MLSALRCIIIVVYYCFLIYYDSLATILSVLFCFFSSRRRHTRCALVTGVQTCALPILDGRNVAVARQPCLIGAKPHGSTHVAARLALLEPQIGRASCRERVCQYV